MNIKNIMVCLYDKEDVLIRGTALTVTQLKQHFKNKKIALSDIYEVREDEIQYHSFDPLYADEKFDKACLN